MPKLGMFARVIKGGEIKVNDEIKVVDNPHRLTAAVITLSDKGYKGEREDVSGPLLVKALKEKGYQVEEYKILPDEKELLKNELINLADRRDISLVLTTGGTGFSHRDVTPEATKEVIERDAPGISEAIRYESLKFTPKAMLSRGVSGIRNKSLIINLPGSPKAVKESLDVFIDVVDHALKLLRGEDGECARKD